MRRFIMQLTVVALGLSLAGAVQAGGKGGSGGSGSKSFSQSNKSFNSSNSKNFSYSKYGKCFSKYDFCWSHSCYCSRYGCNCYWYDSCWYVWYQPTCQYIPYTYYVTLGNAGCGCHSWSSARSWSEVTGRSQTYSY